MLSRPLRRLTVLGSAAALALSVAAPAANAHHARPPGPVNAQTTYDWGKPIWQDDFVGPRKDLWRVAGRGNVRNQHGMLTLNTARKGSVSATLKGTGHKNGRWEIRLRSRQYSRANASYKVRTELVPAAKRPQHCGARNIALNSYTLGGNRAHHYIRTLPNRQAVSHTGVNLGTDRWHTFAVELTEKRVSWFVDGHVISTTRRSSANAKLPYTVRFTMVGKPGARMNQSRMQMDWLRYFTLRKPNSKSVQAPAPRTAAYADAC